ncbi:MAG: peptidase S8 [Candidatus Eremiobacteraeota bacterium]|nr:peptidase S8 [Candidatus Eremiobacteraeota bacterium]
MRYRLPVLIAALLLGAGCSSSHGAGLPPIAQANHAIQTAPSTQGSTRKPLDIGAFPADIDAFPVDMGAIPVNSSAFPVCTQQSGHALCHSQYRSDIPAIPVANLPQGQIPGYHPADLQNAYGLSTAIAAGANQTIAVIVAYHAPYLASDLATYRQAFGLPACSFGPTATTGPVAAAPGMMGPTMPGGPTPIGPAAGGSCLRFVYSGGSQPPVSIAWDIEATLDVEMVSAICPRCRIMVVEAPDDMISSLSAAVDVAVRNGATEISNSYTAPETDTSLQQYESHYNHPGVPITAAAGDTGFGTGFPASVNGVIAVGGTSLINAPGYGWASAVWQGTGSGCAMWGSKPAWQTDNLCATRTMNDLAVVADPATGVAAYVSPAGGWAVFGGTSVSSPMVASMYALAGNASSINAAQSLYANAGSFNPVTARSNGTCSIFLLCNGGIGFDAPSGLGSPYGLSAF